MLKLLGFINGNIKSYFGFYPTTLKGAQGTAVVSVAEHFTTVGTIMTEGGCAAELVEDAFIALQIAQAKVNTAIAFGWNNGKY